MQYKGIVSHTQKLQSLGQLAGGVAHDFNNILSIIEGYARILERQLGPQHTAQEKLQHILLATKRGASLTRRLLAFGSQNILSEQICDCVQTIKESRILLEPLVSKKLLLYIHTPDYPLYIGCDSDTLSQILINLATNARDAIQTQGDLWIHVSESPDNTVLLSITDNGSGINEEHLQRIFEPFFTTKPQGQGTGLGLSMIAGLIQQLKGDIAVESRVGHGTKFMLSFPKKSSPYPQKTNNSYHETVPLDKKTILIVDDEEAIIDILESQLRELGLKVLKASNAELALVIQEDYPEPIDLLLTDIVMPGLDGCRLAELFKSQRPETGVIYMTGHPTRRHTMNQPFHLPQDALVLTKPFNTQALSPLLETALKYVRETSQEY